MNTREEEKIYKKIDKGLRYLLNLLHDLHEDENEDGEESASKETYSKNQLYTSQYEIQKSGTVELPDDCRWIVLKYKDENAFSLDLSNEGEIVLALHDPLRDRPADGLLFWPVISFLTKSEAKHLKQELDAALKSLGNEQNAGNIDTVGW